MNPKKVMALAMLVLMALPSLTIAVADDGDGAGLAGAIERARLYLDKVRSSADSMADEYSGNEMIQGYLDDIYDLLGQEGEEGPEYFLESGTYGISELSDVVSHSGTYSVHLKTTGTPGDGDEARIVIPMPEGFTLGDLETLSWWENLTTGYPPHVDVFLNFTGDSDPDDVLVFEYAYNDMTHYDDEAPAPYGALNGSWYRTFNDDGNGPAQITNSSVAWLNSGSPGPDAWVNHTLADWKEGITVTAGTIDADSIVTRLEIEVDNWIVQTEAYVDDIEIGEVTYDFEEEPEALGAEGFLNRASACLGEGQFNSTARYLASARNILGRVNGLLNSMGKAHKVARTQRFMRQFEHRIEGLEDKIGKLTERLGEGANKFKSSMGLARGKLRQLNLTGNNIDLDELENATELINAGFGELEEDETSNTLEAMDRLEAHIRVLKASAERLRRKGCNTTAVDDELEYAETLLNGMMTSLEGGNTEEAESHIEETDELVSDAKDKLKEIRKGHQNKGSKGNGKGQGN